MNCGLKPSDILNFKIFVTEVYFHMPDKLSKKWDTKSKANIYI